MQTGSVRRRWTVAAAALSLYTARSGIHRTSHSRLQQQHSCSKSILEHTSSTKNMKKLHASGYYNIVVQELILMIFGKNIAARAGTKNVLFFHTPNQCFCTTWQTPKSVSTHKCCMLVCQQTRIRSSAISMQQLISNFLTTDSSFWRKKTHWKVVLTECWSLLEGWKRYKEEENMLQHKMNTTSGLEMEWAYSQRNR